MCTVACIHDRDGGYFRGILGSTFDIVAHHDDVSVVGYHQNGVLQRLALRPAGNLRIGKTNHTCTKTIGGSLETQSCTGRWLEKERCHYFTF